MGRLMHNIHSALSITYANANVVHLFPSVVRSRPRRNIDPETLAETVQGYRRFVLPDGCKNKSRSTTARENLHPTTIKYNVTKLRILWHHQASSGRTKKKFTTRGHLSYKS
jgi:hypothetical protein